MSTSDIATAPPNPFPDLAPGHLQCLLIGLAFAAGMEFYTFDSVNLVIADISGTLGLSMDEASWLLTVYSSTLFLGVPISVWLAGRVGHKRYLLGSTVIFAIASLGCAVSSSLESLLCWRAVQGFAGSGLIMWWRASVYMLVPKPQRSPSLMRISTVLYLSSALGMLAAGYLTDNYNWRLIFLPNLIYAACAILLLTRYFPDLPPSSSPRAVREDLIGVILIGLALVTLQIALNRGQVDDWLGSNHIRALLIVSALSFLAFIFWQLSQWNPAPLLDLSLLRDRFVLSSVLIGLIAGMVLSGSLFVLPEFLRNLSSHRYDATHAGQVLCIYALTAAAVRPLMVKMIATLGQRKAIAIAFGMLICSMLLFQRVLTTGTSWESYVLPLMLFGLCLSPLLPAVGSGTVARIDQSRLLDGVSIYMSFRQFGASLGVAIMNILLAHRESVHSARLFEHLHNNRAIVEHSLATLRGSALHHGAPSNADDMALARLVEAARHQSETLSYADAFTFMAVIAVIGMCLIPIIPPTPPAVKK